MNKITTHLLSSFGLLNPPNISSKKQRQMVIKLIAISVLALLGMTFVIGMAAIGKISIGAAAVICVAIIPCTLLVNKFFNRYKKNIQENPQLPVLLKDQLEGEPEYLHTTDDQKIAHLFTTHLFKEVNESGYVSPFKIIEENLSPQYSSEIGELSVRYTLFERDSPVTIPLRKLFGAINWTNLGKAWETDSKTLKQNCLLFRGSYPEGAHLNKPFIRDYSGLDYKGINLFLRTGKLNSCPSGFHIMSRAQCIDRCAKAIFFDCLAISGELNTINPQERSYKEVTRGAQFSDEELQTLLLGRDVYTEPGFCSTTTDVSPPSAFKKNVTFKISTFSGKSIKAFSSSPGEEEVLLPPQRKFYIKETIQIGEKYTVTLTEIPEEMLAT